MDNYFDLYSSKIKRINIPLPSFQFFHKASSEEKVDSKFIGREKITDKLYSWLLNEEEGGSYLVTGFRGMGKSSFVGRVLNELTQKETGKDYFWGISFFIFLFVIGVLLIPFATHIVNFYKDNNNYILYPIFSSFLICGIIYICYYYIKQRDDIREKDDIMLTCTIIPFSVSILELCLCPFCNDNSFFLYFFPVWQLLFSIIIYNIYLALFKEQRNNRKKYDEFKLSLEKEYNNLPSEYKKETNSKQFLTNNNDKIDWKRACRVLHGDYIKNRSYHRICISVNLGQEVLNERDVLSLISHQLYTKYREYVLSPITNFFNWLFYLLLIFIPFWCLFFILLFYKKNEYETDKIIEGIILLAAVIIALYLISLKFSSSQTKILRRLHLLNERLDAQVTFSETYTAGIGRPEEESHYSKAEHTKTRSYDIAKVREIEQELIDVLNSISKSFCNWKKSPSFIFVFDELDKVDSNSLQGYSFDNKTDFSNERNFPGGGTTRRRKQNVLHLLANMKLFISTAKAKFIFISGRELYDAYLADLSDREFAVSSIFSGVIYVDSFCVNENMGKGVMSNVEMYICKQLMPKEYIKKRFVRQYIIELAQGTTHEKFDIDLKMYYQYLVEYYSKLIPGFDKPEDDMSAYKTTAEYYAQKNLYRRYIDKTINLLYHFSVYLYHISNGSPKKMMLHFEKYIKNIYEKDQSPFSKESIELFPIDPNKPINIYSPKPIEHYLSFGYLAQRTIGFIHYISFPINQILVNANQYSDKLLVSVSFLMDHIYKFHNGGFSWRNMEYTPELLEVYKIPGFRGFINSIISYLQQTHIVSVSCGLYQFKFRRKIAEEISLASRFSEEIAALFNFTLDESRNVKQHYSDMLDASLALEAKGDKHTPRATVGLHNILGDLYLFDEEINNAILEYHTAINELEQEMKEKSKENPDLQNMLYLIRLLLKLGLANEKRNTNETALVTYSNLVASLLGFRHFNEQDLQLTYRLRRSGEWPTYEGVIFPKKDDRWSDYEFNLVHPKIIQDSDSIYTTDTEFMASGQQLSNIFAHLLTPEKYSIIQRISLFQDFRLVYQALLAKLFIKEKINLGGITLTDLEIIESEYLYLNLATNVKEKFLTTSDFFRRLGDIMYYKNGLTAPEQEDSFVEGLTYWGIDIKREILDFCNINKCYQRYETILNELKNITNNELISKKHKSVYRVLNERIKTLKSKDFILNKQLKYISTEKVITCNKHRHNMFKDNKPIPCHACKYYNRSLRTLLRGMFDCDVFTEEYTEYNNVFIVMEKILNKGTSRSLRQEYVIQLGEILDCKGNILLSCTAGDDNIITKLFMKAFFYDLKKSKSIPGTISFQSLNRNKPSSILYQIYAGNMHTQIHKLEESILYYWEASVCFAIGNDLMKASASLKKILRIFQNYLKTATDEKRENRKELVSNNINNLKEYIIKQCLVYQYSHYNNINITEIQELKWIFSVKMYENIPLNRLSLFPDVEHIMILYYDILRRCSKGDEHAKKLVNLYCNTGFGFLRQEGTTFERVMALRFKILMNLDFVKLVLLSQEDSKNIYYEKAQITNFVNYMFEYITSKEKIQDKLKGYKKCFDLALILNKNKNENNGSDFTTKLQFLEFLTEDSLFCITRIIEIITPRNTATLFTNSFYGELYQMLYELNALFDSIYTFYNFFDEYLSKKKVSCKNTTERKREFYKKIKNKIEDISKGNPERVMIIKQHMEEYKNKKVTMSTHFLNETMQRIGSKAQGNLILMRYPIVMAIESYQDDLEMHHEGKAYKELISQMYYLDDDLKNDTISFGAAIERYKINSGYIDKQKEKLENLNKNSVLNDIETFGQEEIISMDLSERFPRCSMD